MVYKPQSKQRPRGKKRPCCLPRGQKAGLGRPSEAGGGQSHRPHGWRGSDSAAGFLETGDRGQGSVRALVPSRARPSVQAGLCEAHPMCRDTTFLVPRLGRFSPLGTPLDSGGLGEPQEPGQSPLLKVCVVSVWVFFEEPGKGRQSSVRGG